MDGAVNTSTNAIYVANFNDNTVTVIDGLTNTVVTTIIPAGGSPFPTGIGVNSLNNSIYVAEFNSDIVTIIDGVTNMVTQAVISVIPVGARPFLIGVNP